MAMNYQEAVVASEQLVLRNKFSLEEKKVIEEAHGVIYTLTGLTLDAQRAARVEQNKPAFLHGLSWDGERFTAVPLKLKQIELAIFPDPQEFFVPGSFGRKTAVQEKMAAEDAKTLSLPNVTQIIPDEASTLTEIVFQHETITGEWLFGPEYAKAYGLDWVYGRTKDPIDQTGSLTANVGRSNPDYGVLFNYWHRDYGNPHLGAVRLVAPLGTK